MMQNIHYFHINSNLDDKTTIVFLHEGLGCIKTWQAYPKILCDQLKVRGLVYDRHGYGQSDGNLNNRTDEYLIEAADELFDLITFLQFDKIILYGHSDGGSIALAFAAKHQDRVTCIISEAAHVLNEMETISGVKAAVNAFKLGKLNGLKKWHGHKYQNVFEAWANTWLQPSFNLESLKQRLPLVTVNQLIIQGSEDQYGTKKQCQTIESLTSGKTTTFILECGHAPFLECQKEVLEVVTKYIKSETDGKS